MKRVFLISAALASGLFALTDEEILSIYAGAPEDIKIELGSRAKLEELPGFELIEFKISQGDHSQSDFMFANDKYLFTDIIDPVKGIGYKDAAVNKAKITKVKAAYDAEDAVNIIKLGSDASKPTMIVFTDADCPYCRKAMESIDEMLKETNLEIIMASVHGDPSHAKSALIYKDIKDAKTDADKIAVLKKYYAPSFTAEEGKVTPADIKKMSELAQKYHSAGVNSVPHFIPKDQLK